MAKPKWITIGTTEGSMNGSSEITAAAYTGRVAREGTITGTTAGGATDTTAVSQVGAAEVITIERISYSAVAIGQNVTIQGRSNSANLVCQFSAAEGTLPAKLAVAGVTDESWNGNSDTAVDGDPGASAIYDFTITVTIPENKSESTREFKSVVMNAAGNVYSEEVTITQAAGVKNYSKPVVSGFEYPFVEALGREVMPDSSLQITQKWGWNESKTNGGTIVSPIFSDTYPITLEYVKVSGADGVSVNKDNGVVTVPSKGTVVSDKTTAATVRLNLTINGVAADPVTATVEQDANTINYGDVEFSSRVPSVSDIPASGGSIGSSNITWSGEGAIATQTISYTSGATVNISNDTGSTSPVFDAIAVTYSDAITAASKGTAVSARTEAGVITITATGAGDKTATKSVTVYQAANSATYGEVTIGQATPVSLAAPGETYQIVPAMKQTVTYTSGATRTEATPADNKVQLSADYTVKTAKEGFSLETNTGKVTVGLNPTTHERGGFVVTISAEGEGGKTATKDITFNQQGSSSTLDLSPDTMSFIAAGETKTLTITSNDSWTLS